ncbi:Carotenoid 9,10(9',10')-cleavage dioxygenase 1 [Acorus gramineus]|uniref:Carotenoid 9,10(9',10')-cleavage dioxygenase 1 n=1 Tax=Acorus gramineus TaxID=55184 RepID=A0AAV9ATF6_ACOGR|nr:Carotenoid 9,10(9',10')-cleavage dioxygenase 1 [Acorus gramineus]
MRIACAVGKAPPTTPLQHLTSSLNSAFKLPGKYAPVDEIDEAIMLSEIEGEIPKDFPQGIYMRTENHLPYEIDKSNLKTGKIWDVNGAWDRPFTSHPKQRAPGTGEMVIMGVNAVKPYYVVGVISADGEKLLNKVDVKFETPTLSHEIGITENYNIILDYPIRFGLSRLLADKQLIGYERDDGQRSRIGVMPRYGDAESIKWFGPSHKDDKAQWYRQAFSQPPKNSEDFDPSIDGAIFSRPYEWRLNMKTGEVKEGHLARDDIAMDFPAINNRFVGLKNIMLMPKFLIQNNRMSMYKQLAKIYFDEQDEENKEIDKVECHALEDNHFCSGVQFVERPGATDEDDGWVVCYIHDEKSNVSKVYIVDGKKFTELPVAKIILPQRVPYGFHGSYDSVECYYYQQNRRE